MGKQFLNDKNHNIKNMKLREAMNTYNSALSIIKGKGFDIKVELDENQENIDCWTAQKQDFEISGFNPLSLLGLITISEQYGENWRQIKTENLYDEILERDCGK